MEVNASTSEQEICVNCSVHVVYRHFIRITDWFSAWNYYSSMYIRTTSVCLCSISSCDWIQLWHQWVLMWHSLLMWIDCFVWLFILLYCVVIFRDAVFHFKHMYIHIAHAALFNYTTSSGPVTDLTSSSAMAERPCKVWNFFDWRPALFAKSCTKLDF